VIAWTAPVRPARLSPCQSENQSPGVCPFRQLIRMLWDGWEVSMCYEPAKCHRTNYPSAEAEPRVIDLSDSAGTGDHVATGISASSDGGCALIGSSTNCGGVCESSGISASSGGSSAISDSADHEDGEPQRRRREHGAGQQHNSREQSSSSSNYSPE